ncbi:MAG: heat-inducible transcriptional repressor HrcA [Cohaesibacteraceae bacterium]|nr:heat-inducible transcriptional repressor HrcA [Cohaesibacteraceae bacterium]
MVSGSKFSLEKPLLSALDERSREVFRLLVENYLETGEPVGSRNLSKLLPMSLSAASVRNVMSDLEQLGFLYSPHTSAGRLPTDIGLRFFVDGLMEFGDLTREERARIDQEVTASGRGSLEGILTEASQMLSGLSRGAGLVMASKQDIALKHVEFVRLEPTKALVVLVSEDGAVENRVIDLPAGMPASALTEAGNFLNAHIRGKTLSEAKAELDRQKMFLKSELDDLGQKLVKAGIASWAGAQHSEPERLIVRGRSNLLENVSAQEDLERLRHLFDDLEAKRDLVQLLGLAEEGDGVRIYIGSENKLFSLSGSSLIVSPYRDSDQKIIGVVGVIGPTRLNYARIVPMVDYTASVIGKLLT